MSARLSKLLSNLLSNLALNGRVIVIMLVS